MPLPSTITVALGLTLDTVEIPTTTVAPSIPSSPAKALVHKAFDAALTLSATSTPPAQVASYQQFVTTASGTIDLTALKTLFAAAVDCTALKLQALFIQNLDPTNSFTIQAGASNPYAIGGNPVKVQPGGGALMYFNGGLAAIDATHKTLDWTANVTTGNAEVSLILG
jgi:hypothetical protein